MYTISPFWNAAARLAGRLELAPLRQVLRCSPHALSVRALCEAGVPHRFALALVGGESSSSSTPFLTLADPDYPAGLLHADPSPPLLFYRGDLTLLQQPCVSIVGARHCTSEGARMARILASAAVAAGCVVASGLAYGIDSAAHGVCHGRTIAVLGQGLQSPLTRHQQGLAEAIVGDGGLLISEFLPLLRPARWTFPQRNRLIAALGRATVVVEAARRSGALITANKALDLGREVMAVPGSPFQPTAAGCLDLIDNGARMVRSGSDLVSALGLKTVEPAAATHPLLRVLGQGGTIDELLERTDMSVVQLNRALSALELAGLVCRSAGDRYTPVT